MLNETDLSRVDLNLLVLFEAVLLERQVGRAAQRLNLTPSAVSHGLTRLRRLLDDPVFIKHPRGVVPTARALELAGAVDEILARTRTMLGAVAPFDPAASRRRFSLGAPDGVSIVVLPPLLERLRALAPHVDLALKVLLPNAVNDALDAREIDLAVMPVDMLPPRVVAPRFDARRLYEERFVIVGRRGHPWMGSPDVEGYCAAPHVLVSPQGDPRGFMDEVLAGLGLQRRVSLTVPSFLFAMAGIGTTDLLAAVPHQMALSHCERFGLQWAESPVAITPFQICMLAPKAAWADSGVAWLAEQLQTTVAS